jgi:hypothetical protein
MQPDGIAMAGLAVIGLIGGVGISSVGPGGILPTIGLLVLTPLAPAAVAGTSIVTHVATGIAGAAAYHRSGHLAGPATRRTAIILAVTALPGVPLGIVANSHISAHGFGLVIAVIAASVAGLLWYRSSRPATREAGRGVRPTAAVAAVGLLVSAACGLVGIGGPMLTVPLLVLLGMPMLDAVAASQVQAVVVSSIGSIGYAASGSINWLLALMIGVPEVAGVLVGWRVARVLPVRVLTTTLIVTLFAVAPYLALHSGP